MGSTRGTKDIDVVAKKPVFNSFEKIQMVFSDDKAFSIVKGNRRDAIRAIYHPSGVGIDILLQ